MWMLSIYGGIYESFFALPDPEISLRRDTYGTRVWNK